MKHLLAATLLGTLVLTPALALAITNCDNQAVPAIGCPTGYSMTCNPVGGYHWSCGKASGAISAPSSGAAGVVQYRETNLEFTNRESVPASANASATATAATAKETPRVKVRFPWLDSIRMWFENFFQNIFKTKHDTVKNSIGNIR